MGDGYLPDLERDNILSIEKCLGFSLTDDQHWKLQRVYHEYFIIKDQCTMSLRPSEAKTLMDELRETGISFLQKIKRIDESTQQSMILASALRQPERDKMIKRQLKKQKPRLPYHAKVGKPFNLPMIIEELEERIIFLLDSIESIRPKIKKDPGGRSHTQDPLKVFIWKIADYYDEIATPRRATISWSEHNGAYGGRFLDFVGACSSVKFKNRPDAFDEIYSSTALSRQIKEVLSRRKRNKKREE